MPGTPEILQGLFAGLDKAATNIYNISQAQQKQKQDKELFDLKKKQYNLDFQKAEYEMSPEKRAQEKQLRDVEIKREQAEIEERKVITENRKSEEIRKEDELGRELKNNLRFMQNFMPGEYDRIMGTEAYAGEGRGGAPPPETGATGAVESYQPELFEAPEGTEFEWEMGEMPKVKPKKEKTPSFGQEQKIESIRSGLERGKIVIGKEFGEPSVYEPKTMDEALSAVAEADLDPALFQEELKRFEEVSIQDEKGDLFTIPAHQLDQALEQGYTRAEENVEVKNLGEQRTHEGVLYEKKEDGRWHPVE